MNRKAKSCYLKSEDESLLTVYLPDQEAVFVGRCPETDITDRRCSRQQVRLCADYTEYKVSIQQIGKKSSCFNGFKTSKDIKFVAKHNDRLEMLYGKYAYRIEFNPPPSSLSIPLSKKRSMESDTGIEAKNGIFKAMKFDFMDTMKSDSDGEDADNGPGSSNDANAAIARNSLDSGADKEVWHTYDEKSLIIYTSKSTENRSKIAAFDMDGTLIKTRSGLVFPKDYDDWQLIYPDVPKKLKKLFEDGYKLVIFTNQAGIGAGKIDVKRFEHKIKGVQQRIDVPLQFFIATGQSVYRKPAIGMWQALEERNNGGVSIDKSSSFYVGDAAGRPKNWAPGKKKDHSCADRLIALNLGLRFHTPEEYFLGAKPAPYVLPAFNPKNLSSSIELCSAGTELTSKDQEMILMVGCPGSGKSYFTKVHLKEYSYVNRDSLGSWQKCVDAIDRHLKEKKSVVVDNTNGERETRQKYLSVAKKHKVPVRCFVMSTTVQHAKHNNKFRELTDSSHAKIGEATINFYIKNFQAPSAEEGFTEIVRVNFVPQFHTEENRKLYEMYLLES